VGASSAAVLLGFADKAAAAALPASSVPRSDDALPALLERLALRQPAPPASPAAAFSFEYGHWHEANALLVVMTALPELHVHEAGVYRVPFDGLPPMHASPDAIGVLPDGTRLVLEAKSKVPFRHDPARGTYTLLLQQTPTTVDPAHFAQVQLQLLATNTAQAKLAVVPATADAAIFTVNRSDEWLAAAREVLACTLGRLTSAVWAGRPPPGFLRHELGEGKWRAFLELTARLCQQATETVVVVRMPAPARSEYQPAFLHQPADLHAYEREIAACRTSLQYKHVW